MYGSDIYGLAEQLGIVLRARKIRCGAAESCTGGDLSGMLTAIPGSSTWFDCAFITYSNAAKESMLQVSHQVLRKYGAVSEEVARAMAEGVIANSDAEVSVAITGIAGPEGGSEQKPVGSVWIAWAGDKKPTLCRCFYFEGNRPAVRYQAVYKALEGLISRCDPKLQPKKSKPSKARYFFALYPSKKTAALMHKVSGEHLGCEASELTSQENLHLTLAYLGTASEMFIQDCIQQASIIKAPCFKLLINHLTTRNRPKISWLGSLQPPEELFALVRQLNRALIEAGFVPERRRFTPHITVARHAKKTSSSSDVFNINWTVREFCLVRSTTTKEGAKYEVVETWPLGLVNKP